MAISDEQSIESVDSPIFYPSEEFRETAHIQSMETYKKMYLKSIENPEQFWREMSEDFYFKVDQNLIFLNLILIVEKGQLISNGCRELVQNVSYNVLDRNIEKGLGDRTAIIWEGSEPFFPRTITYNELKSEVCKFANVLKKKGIGKGDRVAVYLPVTIELVVAMLACARIGAIHSVIFAGFSGDSIADRILDANCKLLITCDGVYRGNKFIPLKEMADQAVTICKEHNHHLNGVIVYHHLKNIQLRSPENDETGKVKARTGDASNNGQLNKQITIPKSSLIGKPGTNQTQLNCKTTQAQNILTPQQQNGKENKTNGQIKNQLKGQLNGQINKASNEQTANALLNKQSNVQMISKEMEMDLEVPNNKAEVEELMDTSELMAMNSNKTYEISTDQNNNIVMVKCKPIEVSKDKHITKDLNNNNVQQCKISANKKDDQPSETKANQALILNLPSSKDKNNNDIKLNNKDQIKKEVLNKIELSKPNSTSLPQPSSSSSATPMKTATSNSSSVSININSSPKQTTPPMITTNNSSSNNQTSNTNAISKLRKIAEDSVHNAIKIKKLDEQTAIHANGLKTEKKVLKCANNGNVNESNASENVKINRLVDQLTKTRNEELSSSPNENDQTLAQTPSSQLQTKKTQSTTNPNSSKLKIPWNPEIDSWWHDLINQVDDVCEPVWVDAEHPLFILYTSGSTGKPKGVVHSSGGYMVYAATTFKYVFNYHGGDVFFCTADLGWITGHTVNCYGSLANAATIVLFDGTPFYPTPSRLWQIVTSHRVNIFYTAPTAIRSLMGCGESWIKNFDLSSLKLLGTAGEPINKEAWHWYYRMVGKSRCPIVDTYWSTESGAPLISSLPGCTPMKPGSASYPFFGVVPALLDDEGKELTGPSDGHLVFKNAWPGMIRTVDGNHHRFTCTYFYKFPGYYATGDGAKRDKDGYYWITGRTDDLLNVSGHLLSTAQVESALCSNEHIVEAAAVSAPHKVKGECIYCYIVLRKDCVYNKAIENELKNSVRHKIGAIATPEVLHVVSQLPKTRSGKIMRRLLKKIAIGETEFGDLSTIQDESILPEIYETRRIYVY